MLNLVFKCLLNLQFIYLFLLENKRLLLVLTSTARKTATEKRALTYIPLTLRVSVCSRPSVPSCNSKDFPHLDFTDRHTVTNNEFAGPQRELFPGGTKIDAGPPKLREVQTNKSKKGLHSNFGSMFCPKLGKVQKKIFLPKSRWRAKKKGVHSNLVPFYAQSQGRKMGRYEKNFGPTLNPTTSTLPCPLIPGPPRPGPGYDVPPKPPLVGPESL